MSSNEDKLKIYKFIGGAFFTREEVLVVASSLKEAWEFINKDEVLTRVMEFDKVVSLEKGILMNSSVEEW